MFHNYMENRPNYVDPNRKIAKLNADFKLEFLFTFTGYRDKAKGSTLFNNSYML